MKKRIIIVISTAFVPTGGLAGVVMNYYRRIDKTGLQIDIASTNEAPAVLTEELIKYGGHYYCLGKRANVLAYFLNLYKLCKGYDILHVNGNSATTVIEHLAAKLAGVKRRINHNHNSICNHKIMSNMAYPLFNKLVTDRVACSDLAGNWLYGEGNFVILKNAIDIVKYQYNHDVRKKTRKIFSIEDGCIVLGHVGKINKQKNHLYLIRIFAEYKKLNQNSKLLLVGDGDMRLMAEDLVDKLCLSDSVIFAGLRTDIPELLQIMDFFVFPSLWEGLPLSVLEALSSGLPCIISDHITRSIMIGPNIHSLQIESEPKVWANFIANYNLTSREKTCIVAAESITEAGYNIRNETENLEEMYRNN